MSYRGWTGLLAVTILLATVPVVNAQMPDEFKNLKVLPGDVGKDELVATMKNFAISLGVRCDHCHVGPPEGSLDKFDFASDEKPAKDITRVMMRMTQAINGDHLDKVEKPGSTAVRVDCATCHRGKPLPAKPEEIFSEIMGGR